MEDLLGNENTDNTAEGISTDLVAIPATNNVAQGTNGWGIRTCASDAIDCATIEELSASYRALKPYSSVENKVFYANDSGAINKVTLFEIGVGVSPTLPAGTYSTKMIVTATNT